MPICRKFIYFDLRVYKSPKRWYFLGSSIYQYSNNSCYILYSVALPLRRFLLPQLVSSTQQTIESTSSPKMLQASMACVQLNPIDKTISMLLLSTVFSIGFLSLPEVPVSKNISFFLSLRNIQAIEGFNRQRLTHQLQKRTSQHQRWMIPWDQFVVQTVP